MGYTHKTSCILVSEGPLKLKMVSNDGFDFVLLVYKLIEQSLYVTFKNDFVKVTQT